MSPGRLQEQLKPRWDPTFNWGHIGMILTILISGVLYYGKIDSELEQGRQARAVYIPKILNLEANDLLQTERIANLAASAEVARQTNVKTTEALSLILRDVAVIKAVVNAAQKDRLNMPSSKDNE